MAGVIYGLPTEFAIWSHAHLGYYFCLGIFCISAWFLYRSVSREAILAYGRVHWRGLLLALGVGLSLQFFQDRQMRVYNDEPSHQMVAKSMHEWRQVSTPEVGYYLEGQTEYGQPSLSYRMYFYSFLGSLAHDLTGFRVLNGWAINAVLGILFFLLVHGIGTRLYKRSGGIFAVFLGAGLPLLDLSATGYGYDLANVTALAALFLGSFAYVERPDSDRLGLMIALALIAAMSRNESALFLLFPVAIFCGVSFTRSEWAPLGWFAPISPLFLLPVLAAREVFRAADPAAQYVSMGEGSFFQLSAIPENIVRIGLWLFEWSPIHASFPLLSLFGVLGLVGLLTTVLLKLIRRSPLPVHTCLVLGFVAVGLATSLLTIFGQFWNPLAGEAIRFLLPLHLLFLILAAWWLSGLSTAHRIAPGLLIVVGAIVFLFGLSSRIAESRGNNAAFAQHAAWSLEWLEENDERKTLYVTPLNSLFLLHDYATVSWLIADARIRDLMQLVREGYYDRVVGFVIERYDVANDVWAPVEPTKHLGDHILTRELEQRRYAYNTRARFFELEGFIDAKGNVSRPEDLEYLKERNYSSFREYFEHMQSIHPGYTWHP